LSQPASGSRKKIGLWIATSLVVGNMIGSGVFLLPASLAPYGGISMVGWIVSAGGALLLAGVFARLSAVMPAAGGHYAFTRSGLGDFAAFLVAWGYWISIWCGNAAISVGFVGYFSALVPGLDDSPQLQVGVAVAAIWLLTYVNSRGIREAGIMQLVTTILKLVPLALVGLVGLAFIDRANLEPFNATGGPALDAIGATAALTLWAFLGLESASVPADDVVDPKRTIPRATYIGTGITAVVYMAGTLAVMGMMPASELAVSTAPFADAAARMWGGWARNIVALGAAISAFGALNGWILLSGQIPMAAARDRLFPVRFAAVNGAGAPVFGLIVSSVFATGIMALNYTRGLVGMFTFIVLLSTMTAVVPYVFTATAELLIRIRKPELFDSGRMKRHGALALMAGAYGTWAIGGSGQETVFWGFLLLMAGLPVYVWIHWTNARRGESI
jgi:APA family basic amino acid/polyamine antiporter